MNDPINPGTGFAQKRYRRLARLLSLDGGGIRGIVTIIVCSCTKARQNRVVNKLNLTIPLDSFVGLP